MSQMERGSDIDHGLSLGVSPREISLPASLRGKPRLTKEVHEFSSVLETPEMYEHLEVSLKARQLR